MSSHKTDELRELSRDALVPFDGALDRVLRFYGLLLAENEKQNLTRLISPVEFFYGHLLDCIELLRAGPFPESVVDLGSGCGVPGLLTAAILPEATKWLLIEAEGRKAEFLERATSEMGLSAHVKAVHGRAEAVLLGLEPNWIVTRAVGKIEKLFFWTENCSTWNKFVLFKGPNWENEWSEFEKSKYRGRLKVINQTEYSAGTHGGTRRIVFLARVPRGTK